MLASSWTAIGKREKDWNGLYSVTSFSEKVMRRPTSESGVGEIVKKLNSKRRYLVHFERSKIGLGWLLIEEKCNYIYI